MVIENNLRALFLGLNVLFSRILGLLYDISHRLFSYNTENAF